MGISKPLSKQILGSLVAIAGAESYKAFNNIIRFPSSVLIQEVQSFFIRRNTGFNNSFEGSHEYGIVKIITTEGWRFFNWKGTYPLLFGDKGTELGLLGLKLDNFLKCDFAWAWTIFSCPDVNDGGVNGFPEPKD